MNRRTTLFSEQTVTKIAYPSRMRIEVERWRSRFLLPRCFRLEAAFLGSLNTNGKGE